MLVAVSQRSSEDREPALATRSHTVDIILKLSEWNIMQLRYLARVHACAILVHAGSLYLDEVVVALDRVRVTS